MDGPWSTAILTKYGYSVIRHDKVQELHDKAKETHEYKSAHQRISGGKSLFEKLIVYPNGYLSNIEARLKHPQMFGLEEIEHQQIMHLLNESDLDFSFKEGGIKASNVDVAYDVLSCFLEDKSQIGVEKVGTSLRIFNKPNMLKRLISNYGETLISISMGDIVKVDVGLTAIGFTAKDRTTCGVGRKWFKSFHMMNGVFLA